jgi:hypothetical protein
MLQAPRADAGSSEATDARSESKWGSRRVKSITRVLAAAVLAIATMAGPGTMAGPLSVSVRAATVAPSLATDAVPPIDDGSHPPGDNIDRGHVDPSGGSGGGGGGSFGEVLAYLVGGVVLLGAIGAVLAK